MPRRLYEYAGRRVPAQMEDIIVDITTIPAEQLKRDKADSLEDIIICQKAIEYKVKYSGGSIQDRLDTNRRIVRKINKELLRRELKEV